jgi:hypothetical protein
MELSRRLQATRLTARDIRALTHDPEFQAIAGRNSQLAFTKNYASYECGLSVNGKKLTAIYEISVGHIKQLRHAVPQQRDAAQPNCGRPPSLMED